ncbi:Transmembrane protein 220 like protein [Argiope bruennichi]|uniref:Transmembrane protein 220 like protein n=1 Tax=Argiope bruennichi TaxID=94029 RepID=A0A8T0FZ69_ARGBR|nr:Transmembrane protein 220 like protein [Argiope bruennichi]
MNDMEVIELKEPLRDCNLSNEEEQEQVFVKKSEKQKSAESGGKILWRGTNAMMTLFFVMASGVQFNDPDPFLWVPLYGIAAILTISVTIRPNITAFRIWRYMYWIHAAFCIGMLIYVLVALILVATNPKSDGSLNPLTYEEGREMAGIMITSVWLFTCKQSPTISYDSPTKLSKKENMVAVAVLFLSLLPLLLWSLCYSDIMSSSYISLCSDFFPEEFSF